MLAILSTHPIQYQVPLWQALGREGSVPFEVWYLTDHGERPSYDHEFGKTFAWDLDLLSGYPHRRLPNYEANQLNGFTKARIDNSFDELLKRKKVRVLWVQGWQPLAYLQAIWKAHAAGVEVWVRGESNDLSVAPFWKKSLKRVFLGQLFKRIDNFLCIGSANKRLYESYGVSRERLHSAPYFVDNERFIKQAEALAPRRRDIRHSWKIPDDAFCILFAGKFIPKKRPFDLVHALTWLHLQRPGRPVHLLFVGSGELGTDLRQACHVVYDADSHVFTEAAGEAHGNSPRASFAGFLNQTEISKAYVAADCMVLPSDHGETWGLVVNEAMASGLPCIVSDACGCAEDLISPLDPSLRTSLGDVEAIGSAVMRLMENTVPPSALREHVASFDLLKSIEVVRSLYRGF
jgi:glycosyltransferase involved in cell wall biosynthesis